MPLKLWLVLFLLMIPGFYVLADVSSSTYHVEQVQIIEKDYVPARSRSSEKYIIVFRRHGEEIESYEITQSMYVLAKSGKSMELEFRLGGLSGKLWEVLIP